MFYGPGIGGSSETLSHTRKKVSALINRSLGSFTQEDEFRRMESDDDDS